MQKSTRRITDSLIEPFRSIRGQPDGCIRVAGLLKNAEAFCLEDALEELPPDDRSKSGE